MEELNARRNNLKPKEEVKENKTPYWTQRLASIIIDLGLLLVFMMCFIKLLKMTPLGDQINSYQTQMFEIKNDYGTKPLVDSSYETLFLKVYLTEENKGQYEGRHQYKDENDKVYVLTNNDKIDENLFNELKSKYLDLIKNDKTYQAAEFNLRFTSYGVDILSISISNLILTLAIPLINKRRATIGQLLAGLRCINSTLETNAKWYKIVWRYVFVMIFEVALPCLSALSVYSLIVVAFLSYFIALFNENKREIRDYITKTRFIDNKTYVPIGKSK